MEEETQATASNPTADPLIARLAAAFHNDYCNHRSEEAMGYHREYRPCELRAVADLKVFRSLPVEERMEAMGMERSGWSGHRRGVWNEVGRVHDKNSVHMDGCIPLYIESAPLPAGRNT